MSTLSPRLLAPDDRDALRTDEGALTYRELARACARHLDALRDAGVSQGDRVAVWTHPSLATAVALAAHAVGGVVSVPLNPKLGARELAHVLGDARPSLVVGSKSEHRALTELPFLTARVALDGDETLPALEVDASPLLVLYTSGTTGAPKGAVLTRRNAAFDLDGLADAWGWSAEDTVVHALPLFHVHGLVLGLFGALRTGGALDWAARFDPEAISARLQRGQTLLFAVPTMYHRLIEAAEREPSVREGLSAARLLVSGSAGLPVREHRRIEALTGRGVLERYGLTETLINTAVRADTGPRPGWVGAPLRGIELALVDDARSVVEDRDVIAEVRVRGPNVFGGYLDRPEATAKVLDADGWFYTGDLATRGPDGAIRIVGRRATDLIKTGGFKVGAGEVEAALLEHPAVREAAVIGAPDDDLGERIVAFIVPRAEVGEGELIDHVADLLAPHKRPRAVRFVEALPRNAMGKVVKSALRDASE